VIVAEADLREIEALQSQWGPSSAGALRRALKGELYRIKAGLEGMLRAGVPPAKAPLTRAVAETRGGAALRWFSRMIAYEVRSLAGAGLEGKTGLTAAAARRARVPDPRFLAPLVTGQRVRIDPEDQAALARRLRERGVSEKRIAKMIPAEKTSVWIPKRDFVRDYMTREVLPKTLANLATLYRTALEGKRWKSRWWAD
jgi:hypothetical protein